MTEPTGSGAGAASAGAAASLGASAGGGASLAVIVQSSLSGWGHPQCVLVGERTESDALFALHVVCQGQLRRADFALERAALDDVEAAAPSAPAEDANQCESAGRRQPGP